jgi:hypothetical protein
MPISDRRSLSYESRLLKYARRGFAVVLPPSVRMDAISPALFTGAAMSKIGTSTGLRLLLQLDFAANNPERCGDMLSLCVSLNSRLL